MSRYQIGVVIIVTVCVLLVLDLFLALDKIPGNTIFEKLRAKIGLDKE